MKKNLNKLAAILAVIIGAMAVYAGGKVLLGIDPGYYVIDWLPVYNFGIGLITVVFTAVLLWKNHPYARTIAGATLAAHAIVMMILQTTYQQEVAAQSIMAMTIRIVVWIAILVLLWIHSRSSKGVQHGIGTKAKETQFE